MSIEGVHEPSPVHWVRTRPYRARLVQDETEHDAVWPVACAAFPPYGQYQNKVRGVRQIPVFVLEPRQA